MAHPAESAGTQQKIVAAGGIRDQLGEDQTGAASVCRIGGVAAETLRHRSGARHVHRNPGIPSRQRVGEIDAASRSDLTGLLEELQPLAASPRRRQEPRSQPDRDLEVDAAGIAAAVGLIAG